MKRLCIVVGLIYLITFSVVTSGFGDECRGDLDGNGAADGTDLAEFALDYGSTECPIKPDFFSQCTTSQSGNNPLETYHTSVCRY